MASKGASPKEQINLTVDSRTARALRLIAMRDGKSVPDLLRPAIERLVRGRLNKDSDLAASVQALEASVSSDQPVRGGKQKVAAVTDLRPKPQSDQRRPAKNQTANRLFANESAPVVSGTLWGGVVSVS